MLTPTLDAENFNLSKASVINYFYEDPDTE